MNRNELKQIHQHTANHREEILRSSRCFCIYCLTDFRPTEIEDWIDNGSTALCPHCSIDAVLGDACPHNFTPSILQQLHNCLFPED